MPTSGASFVVASFRPMLGIPQPFARKLTCASGVENVSEMIPATGVISESGVWMMTISLGSNVRSDSGTSGGTIRSVPIAVPLLNAWYVAAL